MRKIIYLIHISSDQKELHLSYVKKNTDISEPNLDYEVLDF